MGILAGGCASSSATPHTAAPTGTTSTGDDPTCTVIPPILVSRVLGGAVPKRESNINSAGGENCTFVPPDGASATDVVVLTGMGRAQYDGQRGLAAQGAGRPVAPVAHLGDDAYAFSEGGRNHVDFLKGTVEIDVFTTAPAARAEALARAVEPLMFGSR